MCTYGGPSDPNSARPGSEGPHVGGMSAADRGYSTSLLMRSFMILTDSVTFG